MKHPIKKEYINYLDNIIGGKVVKGILLVFPTDEEDLDRTELNLEVTKHNKTFNITFSQPFDSGIIYPYLEKVVANYSISDLPERIKIWKTNNYWHCREKTQDKLGENFFLYECFNIEGEKEYLGIIDSIIIKIIVYYYTLKKDDLKYPVSYCLEFSSGKKIWYILEDGENIISTIYPQIQFQNLWTGIKTFEITEYSQYK